MLIPDTNHIAKAINYKIVTYSPQLGTICVFVKDDYTLIVYKQGLEILFIFSIFKDGSGTLVPPPLDFQNEI